MRLTRTRIGRNAVQIAIAQHPLRQRRKWNAANAFIRQHIEQTLLHPTVQHRITRLMNQTRRAQFAQHVDRLRSQRRRIIRQTDVQRLTLPHHQIQRTHGFVQRRVGIGAMMVKNIHIIQPHAFQTLIQTGDQILFRAKIPIRPIPHGVTGFGRNNQFIPIRAKIAFEDGAEVLLRRAGRRPVIIRQIKMRHTAVKRRAQGLPIMLKAVHAAKVVP